MALIHKNEVVYSTLVNFVSENKFFAGGGWKALKETLLLFEEAGPISGNPATDPAPEYVPYREPFTYELRNPNNLGNRVPEV